MLKNKIKITFSKKRKKYKKKKKKRLLSIEGWKQHITIGTHVINV